MKLLKGLKCISALLTAMFVCQSANAVQFSDSDIEQYREVLKYMKGMKNLPGTGFNIAEGGQEGRTETFLISSNGRFVIRNVEVIDTWNGHLMKSLDDVAFLNKIDFSKMRIRMDEMLTFTVGKAGAKENVIFVDPKCPYCKTMLEQIQKMTSTHRFRIVVSPILGEESVEISKRLNCVADKSVAVKALLTNNYANLPPVKEGCDTEPMSRAIVIGRLLGNNAVPFLVSSTGEIHRGMVKDLAGTLANDEKVAVSKGVQK